MSAQPKPIPMASHSSAGHSDLFGLAHSSPQHEYTIPGSLERSFQQPGSPVSRKLTTLPPKVMTPFASSGIKVLLLENVNHSAVDMLKAQGYQVDEVKKSLDEEELIKTLKEGKYSALGIRSKTKVTRRVIQQTSSTLLAIGCFCIGTNQVDLLAAAKFGISVFNSPYANSRSVAELVIAEVIALSRQLFDRSAELHRGLWNKASAGCWEVRGKTLGIVGYGHIGSQLSVLAESMGMRVVYVDILPIMPLGSAQQMDTLDELLAIADFVTLHVPELPETIDMIGKSQFAKMKKGSYFINNARGRLVDIEALIEAMEKKQLAGAAIDVYPQEPNRNGELFNDECNSWTSQLQQLPNLILSPHIGGSTEEAQRAIGVEVGAAFVRYINFGASVGSVNFPEVSLRPILEEGVVRVCHVHLNQPGVLKTINNIVGDYNVEKQYSDSKGDIAYLMADISEVSEKDMSTLFERISKTTSNIATRILF